FRQFYLFNSNPINIYMYNKNIGFMMTNDNQTLKTINGGDNWFQVIANHGFSDIYFSDSLTGWIARPYKTTDGGITWIDHYSNLPKIFQNVFYQMSKFSKDTIWGVGGSEYYNGYRAIVYRTTNGGTNWGYQRLDTSVHAFRYEFCNFVNKLNGWAYYLTGSGIHTVVGGNDTTIFTGINNNGTIISNEFILYQNYPNPFNPVSSIKYQVLRSAEIKLIIYNITGKEITTLVNKKQTSGIYEVKFDGGTLSSGIYFYTLFADEVRVDTKKMLMIK
ncbi:MAG: T9SS type A sorting domain-containing protein, partial [Ignavibacteriae bacterium]|nr:T9SS type A sorting domain-containing protein [Ignavibacteriota bacterium]